MAETLAEALATPAPVTLSTGEVQVRKLLLRDLDAAIRLYFAFLAGLVGDMERQPTEEEALAEMPTILGLAHAAGDADVLALLQLVSAVTAEQLDGANLGDLEALWGACYRANKVPFGRAMAKATPEFLAELSRRVSKSSPPDSTPPDSTPETPPSP